VSNTIVIENPTYAGRRFTSLESAARYVRRGIARWTGVGRIRFIEDTHECVSAGIAALGYDRHNVIMTVKQIRGIPFTNPRKAITG
jgi:hypothetical protein